MYKSIIESPIALRWMVSKNNLMGKNEVWSESVKIPKIPGFDYHLGVAFIGYEEDRSAHVECRFIFDNVMNHQSAVSFAFTLQSDQKKIVAKDDAFHELDGSGYKGILCTKEELLDPQNGYFADDFITIDFEGNLKVAADYDSDAFKFLEIPPPSDLLNSLWYDENKDGTIVSNGQYIKYHMNILSFAPFVNTTQHTIIEFDPDIIKLAIEFFYQRNIKDRITAEKGCKLVLFAKRYDMERLDLFCQLAMIEQLSAGNVVKYSNVAFKSEGLEFLQDYCIARIIKFNEEKMFIKDIETLDEKVAVEMVRRSAFQTSKISK